MSGWWDPGVVHADRGTGVTDPSFSSPAHPQLTFRPHTLLTTPSFSGHRPYPLSRGDSPGVLVLVLPPVSHTITPRRGTDTTRPRRRVPTRPPGGSHRGSKEPSRRNWTPTLYTGGEPDGSRTDDKGTGGNKMGSPEDGPLADDFRPGTTEDGPTRGREGETDGPKETPGGRERPPTRSLRRHLTVGTRPGPNRQAGSTLTTSAPLPSPRR